MATSHERVLALCQQIAAWLRAVAMDEGELLTSEERRALIDIALEVDRKGCGAYELHEADRRTEMD